MDKDAVRYLEGGSNQTGLRDQNARLVLSYIRRYGSMAGAELARRSGLSAQTVSNILRALEKQELLKRGKTVKGKIGKPSTPMELNPTGVFSTGLNIGRRSAELVLVDFNGKQIASHSIAYPYPEIGAVFDFIAEGMSKIHQRCPEASNRLTGIGVARPSAIWNWLEQAKAPEAAMRKWKSLNLAEEIAAVTGLDVHIENDMTSACVAEHLLGRGAEFSDFAYIFVGAFVGGGLVMNGKIVWGRTGNAGALGILPVPHKSGGSVQLLEVASLHVLERALEDTDANPERLRQSPEDWSEFDTDVTAWIDTISHYLAIAAASIASVVEIEAVLIDGAMPSDVRSRLAQETARHFAEHDLSGIERPRLEVGSVGRSARSIGAALLPIHSRYFLA